MNLISKKVSERVCNHMNIDHLEAVHSYLKNYCNINDFKSAKMKEITSKCLKIQYDDNIATINFEKEISEKEVHDTLVKMAREIK